MTKKERQTIKAATLGFMYGTKTGRWANCAPGDIYKYVAHAAGFGSPGQVMMSPKQAQAFKREFYGETVKQQSLSEELDQSINRLEQVLSKMKESKEIISNLENTFKTGDVVYHKDIGPCLLRRFIIYNGMNGPEDMLFVENGDKMQDGEVLASVMTSGGQVVLIAKNIVPYTESVRLLYEAKRNRPNE